MQVRNSNSGELFPLSADNFKHRGIAGFEIKSVRAVMGRRICVAFGNRCELGVGVATARLDMPVITMQEKD